MRSIGAALFIVILIGCTATRHAPRDDPHPPIEWRLPYASLQGCCRMASAGLNVRLSREERIEAGLRELQWTRECAELTHATDRIYFDPTDKDARFVRVENDRCEIEVTGAESLSDRWDFLVRERGVQTQYRITGIDGSNVRGKLRASCKVGDEGDGIRGVLLLRPTYLRSVPRSTGLDPYVYEHRLSTDMKDMARATNHGLLRYPKGPTFDHRGRQLGTGRGRVLLVEEASDGTVAITLSIGGADGVAVGDEFRLSRGSKAVGYTRVTRVYKDKAVSEFDSANAGSGSPPRKNDRCSGG